jgi:hypothetical protein
LSVKDDRKKQRKVLRMADEDKIKNEIIESEIVKNLEELEEKVFCPKTITVTPFPTTAFCTRCGIIYKTKIPFDFLCVKCRGQVRQLPDVWLCKNYHITEIDAPERCSQCGKNKFEHLGGYRWKCVNCRKRNDTFRRYCPRCTEKNEVKAENIPKTYADAIRFVTFNENKETSKRLKTEDYNNHGLEVLFGNCDILFLAKEYVVNPFGRPIYYPITDEGEPIVWADIMSSEGIKIKISEKVKEEFSFEWNTFVHSLKHALINAAPKYTGVTRNEFIGIIKPGEDEIIIVDSADGGSGASRLFFMYFEEIWKLASEILKRTDNIFLEINCAEWNKDLNPELVRKYFNNYI